MLSEYFSLCILKVGIIKACVLHVFYMCIMRISLFLVDPKQLMFPFSSISFFSHVPVEVHSVYRQICFQASVFYTIALKGKEEGSV